jgi:hypothetical protein
VLLRTGNIECVEASATAICADHEVFQCSDLDRPRAVREKEPRHRTCRKINVAIGVRAVEARLDREKFAVAKCACFGVAGADRCALDVAPYGGIPQEADRIVRANTVSKCFNLEEEDTEDAQLPFRGRILPGFVVEKIREQYVIAGIPEVCQFALIKSLESAE